MGQGVGESRFLFTRGLWLIFLELTLLRCLGFQFNFDYHVTLLNVLWALGWAMIVLSVLVRVPLSVTTALGLIMIAGHNLLDSIQSSNPVWSILQLSQFHSEKSPAFRFYRISAHSLGWGYSRRIQPWANLCLDMAAEENISVACRTRINGCLRHSSKHQRLRRSDAVDHAEIRTLHRALIFEYQQISTFASISSDDARPCFGSSLGH